MSRTTTTPARRESRPRTRRLRPVAALLALALCAAPQGGCISLDAFYFSPRTTDRYTLEYAASVPQDRRVPEALREQLELRSGETTVFAVFARRPDAEMATAPTVLYHHGNSGNIDSYWERASHLWSMGANVLIYDYPGYGRTAGRVTEAGIYASANAALAHLRGLGAQIDQSRLYHYGFSLGSAPACELASMDRSAGLILEAPFTSAAGLASDASLVVPRSFVLSLQLDNRAKIRRAAALARQGVLIIHGEADDFVQTHFGQQLFDEVRMEPPAGPSQLVLVPGANHGDVPQVADAMNNLYSNTMRAFLRVP